MYIFFGALVAKWMSGAFFWLLCGGGQWWPRELSAKPNLLVKWIKVVLRLFDIKPSSSCEEANYLLSFLCANDIVVRVKWGEKTIFCDPQLIDEWGRRELLLERESEQPEKKWKRGSSCWSVIKVERIYNVNAVVFIHISIYCIYFCVRVGSFCNNININLRFFWGSRGRLKK